MGLNPARQALLQDVCERFVVRPWLQHTGPLRASVAGRGAALAGRTALGLGISAGTSFACSRTVTKSLLAMSMQTQDTSMLFASLPIGGDFAAQLLGTGGSYGTLAAAACLLGVVTALFTNEPGWQQHAKTALAQAAQGFALAPLWTMTASAVAAASPALVLAIGCTLGVTLLLATRTMGAETTPTVAIAAVALALTGTPVAAQLALGAPVGEIVGSAMGKLAIGTAGAAAYVISSNLSALRDDNTSFLHRCIARCDPDKRLNMFHEREPTVFVDDHYDSLVDELGDIRIQTRANKRVGLRKILLSGPPGTGKTEIAQAIANLTGAIMFAPQAALITESEHPALEVTQYFQEAHMQARKQDAPVVLFFDECEQLFTERGTIEQNSDQAKRAVGCTLAFNELLEGVTIPADANLIVIACTNYPQNLEKSILSRFSSCHVRIRVPGPEQVRGILAKRWQTLHGQRAGLRHLNAFLPTTAQQDRLLSVVQKINDSADSPEDKVVGRDLAQAMLGSIKAANARGHTLFQASYQSLLMERFVSCLRDIVAEKVENRRLREQAKAALRANVSMQAPVSGWGNGIRNTFSRGDA